MHDRSCWKKAPAIALALLAACGATADAQNCSQVQTAIVTDYALGPGCTSEVGVCTSGTVSSGELAGTTRFTALSLRPGPKPGSFVYTGELVITTASGSVTLHDHGLLLSNTGDYLEMQQVIAGTGQYAGATGVLTSQGNVTVSGFEGSLNGSICANP